MMEQKLVRAEIIRKFGDLKKAAEALGIKKNTFSANLKKLTPDFLRRLKSVGVNIPDEYIFQNFGGQQVNKSKLDGVTFNQNDTGGDDFKDDYIRRLRLENAELIQRNKELTEELLGLREKLRESHGRKTAGSKRE